MSIQNIQSTAPLLPIQAPSTKQESLSKTDWKTHALVVLSTLLIGIGVSLAVASIYFALIVHPMVALLPTAPIILGIALSAEAEKRKPVKPSPILKPSLSPYLQKQLEGHPPPIGMYNLSPRGNGGNNCWMIAAFQFLSAIFSCQRSFQEKVVSKTEQKESPLSLLYSAINQHYRDRRNPHSSTVSTVDSRDLRAWLNKQRANVPNNNSQQDAMHLVEETFDLAGHFLPLEEVVTQKKNGFYVKGDPHPYPSSWVELDMNLNEPESFNVMFDRFFKSDLINKEIKKEKNKDGEIKKVASEHVIGEINKKFTSSPEGFVVRARRFVAEYDLNTHAQTVANTKITHEIDFPLSLELSAEQCASEEREYIVNAFIEHLGPSLSGGHYRAYVRVGKLWFCLDDEKTYPITPDKAKAMLKKAYIVHFQKNS